MRTHRSKAWTYVVLISIGALAALPNVLPQRLADHLPAWYATNTITLGLDLRGGSHLLLEVDTSELAEEVADDAIERSLEIVRQRLDATGVVEPTVARQGKDTIVVQLPGVDDPARIRDLLGTTAKLTFHLAADEGRLRDGTLRLPDAGAGPAHLVRAGAALEGAHVDDARVGFDETTGDPIVHFELDREGARRFAGITERNVGRALAIVLDGRVISAPVIQSPIPGGSGQISGAFTVAEAADLALLLRAGALPAALDVVEERTVGPDLGSDAIDMGLTTGLVGAALVVACMFVLYGRWGLIANGALVLNVMLIFGALSLLGATLTLPGIAGIVLSIGMAVDANILINERIREESRRGRKALAAVNAGFDRAFGTIVDSNVTTLIATGLLFMFGSGPVKGFAVTMAVGLVTSMFTAVAVTRLVMEWRVRRRGRRPLVIGGLDPSRWLQARGPIPFMRARKFGLTVSALISIAALVILVHPGLNRGVDFAGGTVMEVQAQGATVESLRQALTRHGLADVAIQDFGPAGGFLIRSAGETTVDGGAAIDRIRSAVQGVAPEASFPRVDMVGPRVSESFIEAAVLAVMLAGFGMLGYLWWRFEWPFAAAAIATLGLDLTKMLGFFVLFAIEFNLTAVAALLTLIGYSVNDKVVIFDRMRENLRQQPHVTLTDSFDGSITGTLTRTLFTSLTTFVAILPMALAGGSAVASFAWPMLFGIVLSTSSTIFIASPMVLLLAERHFRGRRLFDEGGGAETMEGPAPRLADRVG